MLLDLAWRSLLNRRNSVILTLLSVMISVTIVLGVEHIRSQARESFNRTVSGVDLVVGAPTGQTTLLLSSVFRIGNVSSGVSWESFQHFANDARVAWAIPLAMGDSHRGYRVIGTNDEYLAHYRYGGDRALSLEQGEWFARQTDAVLGAEAAVSLGYQVGDSMVLSHGLGEVSFSRHDDHPFTVTGILAPTGTPVDQSIHISLAGMEVIHETPATRDFRGIASGGDRQSTEDSPDHDHDEAEADTEHLDLAPAQISAFMVGLENRLTAFALQREINEYDAESLLAILPGLALAELWEMMGVAENVLGLVAIMVMIASLLGLATMLLSSMNERRREIALLRVIGMHAASVLFLIELEALLITLAAIMGAFLAATFALVISQDWLSREYGLFIDVIPVSPQVAVYLGFIVLAAGLLALLPAVSAYRSALGNNLRQR